MMHSSWVYIVTNKLHGTLYIGVTGDLVRRISEHRTHQQRGFSHRYNLERPVWFERFDSIEAAIQRETNMKRWKRAWKIALIQRDNPGWRDLYDDLFTKPSPSGVSQLDAEA